MKIIDNAMLRNQYDVIVIGAGIGGLTAGALLAKRGLKTLVVEQHYIPGGCCTAIRRQGIAFDVGAAMLFGFGDKGYRPHRFVMNELEEEIDMIPHDSIYRMHFLGKTVTFWRDFDKYFKELTELFPNQKNELSALYKRLWKYYESIVVKNDTPTPPTEMHWSEAMKAFFRGPIGMMEVGLLLFKTSKDILDQYITDPMVIKYFDVLMNTFFCCNTAETPGLMCATMFVDTHVGGAYYPSGSPQMLPNKLERALERYGGQILYRHLVKEILVEKGQAYGIRLDDGTEIRAERVVSNSTIWNLYGKLVKAEHLKPKRLERTQKLVPTLSALLIYMGVDAEVVPDTIRPIEMFIDNPDDFGKSNYCVYVPSLDDPSICPPGTHSLTVIAPTDNALWPSFGEGEYHSEEYERVKKAEADKVLARMEQHFPNLRKHIRTIEIGTPPTIERFTLKNWGNVGGPKQMMGQDLIRRPHARTDIKNLYHCGDSTVMGEGVVAATSSAIGAANMVLRDLGLKEFLPRKRAREYVNLVKGRQRPPLPEAEEKLTPASAARLALECQHCEKPGCMKTCPAGIDVLNFVRRVEAGNLSGAARAMREMNPLAEICGYICPAEKLCEKECNRHEFSAQPTSIARLQAWTCEQAGYEGWNRYLPTANGRKVAVVGAGPAGISCAHFLARLGYSVEIYEKGEKPGGMMSQVIPSFRLPEETVKRDLEGIYFPGIKYHFGKELGKDFTVSELQKECAAVFLSPGLWSGRRLNLPGLDTAKATDALSFLKSFKANNEAKIKGRVLVVGGGSVAADAAMAAKKSGAKKVTMVCLESAEEMPALASEIAELTKLGVEVVNCWGPKAAAADKLSFVCCTSVFDAQGKFCPSFDEAKVKELEFDQVIMAVGQAAEPVLAKYLEKEFGKAGLLEVVTETQQIINRPGVYAGGDIVRGAGTVVQAVGDGRRAAIAIDKNLQGSQGSN